MGRRVAGRRARKKKREVGQRWVRAGACKRHENH